VNDGSAWRWRDIPFLIALAFLVIAVWVLREND